MPRCPVCQTIRVVVVLSEPKRSFCARCGARWIQGAPRHTAAQVGGTGAEPPKQPA